MLSKDETMYLTAVFGYSDGCDTSGTTVLAEGFLRQPKKRSTGEIDVVDEQLKRHPRTAGSLFLRD